MSDADTLLYSSHELREIRDNFLQELKDSEKGITTTLQFIKNPLPKQSLVNDDEVFQALVIGGSFYESALLKKQNNKLTIIKQTKGQLPVIDTIETFLNIITQHIDTGASVLALSLAQAMEPVSRNGLLDGKLIGNSKEHSFKGLNGKIVGEEIEKYMWDKHKRKIQVSCANDTVCLLLSGLNISSRTTLSGGIVGTGVNFAIFLNEYLIVNLESGGFNSLNQSETGKQIDNASINKGKYFFEKEVSGIYLYQHFNKLVKTKNVSSTEELSSLADKKDVDREIKTARDLFERSASLIACQISGIYLFKQIPKMSFVMEGSLFWKGWNYKEMVEEYILKLDVPPNAVRFYEVKDSAIIGAARLVAVN